MKKEKVEEEREVIARHACKMILGLLKMAQRMLFICLLLLILGPGNCAAENFTRS